MLVWFFSLCKCRVHSFSEVQYTQHTFSKNYNFLKIKSYPDCPHRLILLNGLTWRVEDLLCSTKTLASHFKHGIHYRKLGAVKKNQWIITTFHPVFLQHFIQSFCDPRHFDSQPSASQLNIYQGPHEKGAVALPLLINPGSAGPQRWATAGPGNPMLYCSVLLGLFNSRPRKRQLREI